MWVFCRIQLNKVLASTLRLRTNGLQVWWETLLTWAEAVKNYKDYLPFFLKNKCVLQFTQKISGI